MIQGFFAHERHRSIASFLALAGFIIIALNWPREQLKVSFLQAVHEGSDTQVRATFHKLAEESMPSTIGWPVAIPVATLKTILGNDTAEAFPWKPFVANLAAAVGLCLISISMVVLTHSVRQVQRGSAPSSDRRWLTIFLVPTSAGAIFLASFCYQYVQNIVAERTLILQLGSFGEVAVATNVPSFIAHRVPPLWLVPFAKVESYSGSVEGLELLGQLDRADGLRSVKIEDGTITNEAWSFLVGCQSLESIRFENCSIVIDHPLVHQTCEVRTLSLSRCTGADSILPNLKSLPNLAGLSFSRTPISESNDLDRYLPRNLQHLRVALNFSVPGRMNLDGFGHLETVQLESLSSRVSDQVFSLTLDHSPQLRSVALSPNVSYDLTASQVPRLNSLTAYQHFSRYRSDDGEYSSLPIRSLLIEGAPSLTSLYLDASYLKQLKFSDTPNLKMVNIGLADSFNERVDFQGKESITRSYREEAEAWFRDLALSDGPTTLDVSGLLLSETDLTPLQNNRRIKELTLQNTGIRAEQLLALNHGNRIHSLDLRGNPINHEELQSLLASYKGIERLQIDTSTLEKIEVVDHPELTQLFGSTCQSAKSVRIVGCPKLTGDLMLGRGVETIEIRDAKSLQSLTMKGPLPKDAILEGFRDLKIVELRGRFVTDEQMEAILGCKSLEELVLSIPNVTPDTLVRLNDLTGLVVLHLAGAKVTDDVVAGLPRLKLLRDVDFSFTEITGKSLEALVHRPNLQRLSVNHSRIQSHELAPITRMHGLMELEVAGINMPPDILLRCLQPSLIERINLSDSMLDKEVLDILYSNEANHLLFVGLKRCGLNDDQVRKIADAHPKLAMDVNGNGISAALIRSLEESGRVFSAANRLAFERYLKQLEGNTKSAEWLGTHEARFQYGTRPHAITQFAPTTVSSSWSSNQSSKPSKAWGRRRLAGIERKNRSIP